MKRTFVTLIFVTLIGMLSIHAADIVEDIDDATRDEVFDAEDCELDSMAGEQPKPVNPIKLRSEQPCIYDMPYSISANYPNYHRLAANTALLVGGGITTLFILNILPEDATDWNKAEQVRTPMFERYYRNVMGGPCWDSDLAIFNYVLHPYAGAAYYMSARSQGFNMWYSLLYSFAVSTVFWEYGVEAFMETPSIQDLFITPLAGWLVGELFYKAKRYIVEHDYRLLGSKALGYVAAFFCDPVNEFLGYFRGNDAHGWTKRHNIELTSQISLQSTPLGSQAPTLSFALTF